MDVCGKDILVPETRGSLCLWHQVAAIVAHLKRVGADRSGEGALAAWPTSGPTPQEAFAVVFHYLASQV